MASLLSLFCGALVAIVAAKIWWMLESRLGDRDFWPGLRELTRRVAAGQAHDEFLRSYAELLRLLSRFLWRTTSRVALSILPMVLAVSLLSTTERRVEISRADRLRVHPPATMVLDIGGAPIAFDQTGTFYCQGSFPLGKLTLLADQGRRATDEFHGALAVSHSSWICVGLRLLGLDALHFADGPALLVIRAADGSPNPLWPYLGDLEASFWCGVLVASALAGCFSLRCKSLQVHRWGLCGRLAPPAAGTATTP